MSPITFTIYFKIYTIYIIYFYFMYKIAVYFFMLVTCIQTYGMDM